MYYTNVLLVKNTLTDNIHTYNNFVINRMQNQNYNKIQLFIICKCKNQHKTK